MLNPTLALLGLLVGASTLSAKDFVIHSFKRLHLNNQFFSEGATLGDLNRDDKGDIISGPYWYEGPDFQKRHEYYPAKPFDPAGYSDNFFAFTHDFNRDGWDDIFIIGFPGKDASWFENPKGKEGHWKRHVVFEPVDNESPHFANLVGDKRPELICNSGGFFGYAAPDWSGPSKPWKFHPISPKGNWQRFTHGLGIGDVNGDGRADIIEKDGWWEQPKSLAGDPIWKKHEFNFGTGGAQMYAYDVNGDGLNDVITSLTAHGYGLAWFEQFRENGKITFREHVFMNKEPHENKYGIKFSQLHAVDLVDMDGDGLKDIITGKRYWAHGAKGDPEPGADPMLYWFKLVRNKDKSVDFIPYLIDKDSGVGTQVVAGDINGDKKTDVVIGNKKGTYVFLQEVRKVSEAEWLNAQPKPYVPPSDKIQNVGIKPVGADGQPLNLDLERGNLEDWTASGDAFKGQPVRGDMVMRRRSDMRSENEGNFWIGTYENGGDKPQGTLTSVPFKVTHPFASFLVAGGSHANTRAELVRADTKAVIFKASGYDAENLRPVVVDLSDHQGKEIFIRVIDQESGGWGHINFDNFKFHEQRPQFPNELDPKKGVAEVPPADIVPFAGLSAEEAAKNATLPPGFKMHVFASEPDVQQPIAFCLDHRGRVWVAEGKTYPKRRGSPPADNRPAGADRSKPTPDQLKDIFGGADRILVLEDTDGDHKFDRKTVFLENLNLVSGLEVGFGGVWIGAAPYLMFVPVEDGDHPKPAGDPKILLDGWDFKADTHETLNTFTWGPDGWLYGCHGVFCPSFVGKPGAPDSERQWCDAGVWRYHPTRQKFEIFTEGGSNPWGIDFDEYGQLWAEMCVIPHLWHMIQGARIQRQGGEHYPINAEESRRYTRARGKPVHPHIYDDIKQHADHVHWAGTRGPHAANARSDSVGGGHAHAGLMCYLGESWPAEYRGKLIIGNIHGQRLNMDIPERRGSGFVGRHDKDFLNFNDTWSQTLNQLYDQDGSVYIIDWYDKNQCHHGREEGHDKSNGRIYKIVYNNQPVSRIDLAKLTDEELVKLVPSKNEFLSRHARRVLDERAHSPKPAQPAGTESRSGDPYRVLERIAEGEEKADVAARLRAMWCLQSIGRLNAGLLFKLTRDKEDYIRAWAVQSAVEWGARDSWLAELQRLAKEDSSPVIRRFVASALHRVSVEDRAHIVAELLKHSEDAADHNLPLMYWFAMEPLVADQPEKMLTAALDTKLPNILQFTTRRVASIGTDDARSLIAKKLGGVDDAARQLEMLNGLAAALKGQRNVPMPAGWPAIESKLSGSANSNVRTLAQTLSLTFGSEKALASLRKTLADQSAPIAARQAALESLVSAKAADLPATLQGLLNDAALRSQALRALAAYSDPKTPAAILSVYDSLNNVEKRDALNTLVSRPAYASALLAAVGAKRVPKSDLTADVVRQLRGFKEPEFQEQMEKIYGATREVTADKREEIERYRTIYRAGGSQPGNASAGRVVYNKVCVQCHTLFEVGGKVGPDITGANRTDLNYLLETIVDPNAVIPNEYRTSEIETKDDRSLTGIITSQDDKTVTMQTANEVITLPRGEIASIRQTQLSMMPEGLLDTLSHQEVRDLIYYLTRPGQSPLPATAGTVEDFFNGKDLARWDGDPAIWSVENGEIVGRTTTGLKRNDFLKSQMLLGDFRLVFKVKLTPNNENSGVQFRSQPHGEHEMKGYQADIGQGWWGKLYEENGRALLWKKPGDMHVKPNDWNTYEIVAVGSRIRTAINGNLCVDLDDPEGARQGIIGLQVHSGGPLEVRFKDFQLELNPGIDLVTMAAK